MNESWGAVREIAVSRTDTGRVDLLSLLESTFDAPTATALVNSCEGSRETVYRRLHEFEELGFVVDQPGGGFRGTRAGWKAMHAYRRVASRLDEEVIAYLAGAESRRKLIRALDDEPARKAELAAAESLPSRPTVHRVLEQFDERGWLRRTADHQFGVTRTAVVAVEQFDWLHTAITQAIEKAPAIHAMSYWVDPPLHALSDGELVVETPDTPHAMLDAAVEAADLRTDGLDHVRSITPVFDPVMFDLFGDYIDEETRQQIIFDQRTYQQLTEPSRIHYLAGAMLAPRVDVRVHPDPLYTGLAVYNEETVMVGGSTRCDRHAAVVGNGSELRRWAEATFDDLWAESRPPSDRFRSWLRRSVPSPLG